MFSPLKPAKLNRNKGKHKTTKTKIFRVILLKIKFTEIKIKEYHIKLTNAVE